MFKEKVEKVVAKIQSRNQSITKFPSLATICDPGQSKFKPQSFKDGSGYVLCCPFKVESKKAILQGMKPVPTDFNGVSPFMMIIMESGSNCFKPGQVVHINPAQYDNGGVDNNFMIIQSAIAYLLPDSCIQGIDYYITDLANEVELLKLTADA